MAMRRVLALIYLVSTVVLSSHDVWALTEFQSKVGGFSVLLPGTPEEKTITNTDRQGVEYTQTQFLVAAESGTVLVSFQDNPQLVDADDDKVALALERGRDALLELAKGPVIRDEPIKLEGTHVGRSFAAKIPAMQGEICARLYLVSGRLYQVIVVGTPEFANSEEATKILDSFKLVTAQSGQ